MNFYRYFYDIKNPFIKITDIQSDNVQEYITLIKNNSLATKTYNKEYIEKRLKTEEKMRKKFIEKGGKPVLKHPHYLVLENCDYWFYHIKDNFASIVINSNKFPEDVISFTYGDSVPTFDTKFGDGKEYRNQIYTIDEIKKIIEKYSYPQLWNANSRYGFENYIEVQIWTDDIIDDYKFNKEEVNINKQLDIFSNAVIDGNKRLKSVLYSFPSQIMFENFNKYCKENNATKKIKTYYNLFKEIYEEDKMHGIEHAYRTALYMMIMGKIAEIDDKYLDTILITAFAHDIGRKYSNEEEHGKIGADILATIIEDNDHIKIMKKAITAHSISNYKLYIDMNCIDDIERKILIWLRDADTLDYIRFGTRQYDPTLLQTEEAKKLVKFAMKLNLYMYVYPNDDYKLTVNKE